MQVSRPTESSLDAAALANRDALVTINRVERLTEILAAMPVPWRFIINYKLFKFMSRAPSLLDATAILRIAYPEVF